MRSRLGVIISLATVSLKSTAFLMISVSRLSSTPPFRLSLAMILISSSESASSLSLAGFTPMILSETAAMKSNAFMIGKNIIQKI